MVDFVKVAETEELSPGEKMVIEIDGQFIALFNVNGNYYAIDDVCTHDGGPLAEGELEGYEIICPRHGARFDVRSGAALAMPAFEPVSSYQVKVEGKDILIALSEQQAI
jgi:3-phenylpropionate/trans-cinnamate dioxygenase ferredoxin subunit